MSAGAVSGASMDQAWIPYCGIAPSPGEWLARWNFDPLLLAALLLAGVLAWRSDDRRPAMAGVALLAFLYVSPLCALSSALFSVRVAHHLAVVAFAAPLLAAAAPARALPGSLALWTGLQAVTLWLWHAPPAYAAALSSDGLYWAMQLSLLASAVGFWRALARAETPAAVAALLATTVQMGLLGALITFASAPLYAPHILTTAAWGLSPLEDQQLAGLVMWVPAAMIYLAAALVRVYRWLEAGQATAAG